MRAIKFAFPMMPSAEESKAERLKRQQARFRDRGGAFVPSNSNPLVDILLARTVSGESPSKARPKNVSARLPSPSKAARAKEENNPVAGSSKAKKPAPRKRKPKTVELEGDETIKKRRGRPAKGNKKVPDIGSKELLPTHTNPTPKGKGKQRTNQPATSTSDACARTKTKPKAKARSNTNKTVVEMLFSDDDQTLVEAPHKAESSSKRLILRIEDDTDEDTPLITKRTLPPVDHSKASGARIAERVKDMGANSVKRNPKDPEEDTQEGESARVKVKKRVVQHEEDDEVTPPPTKRRKPTKSQHPVEPETVPRTKTTDAPQAKENGKSRRHPDRIVAVQRDEHRSPKPAKRKQEEDNYDDRPRKAVKFTETGPLHSSSKKLKENHSGAKSVSNTNGKGRLGPRYPSPAAKPPMRAKMSTSKGPPREVLERIKASVAQYLRGADSEPDELDCLS